MRRERHPRRLGGSHFYMSRGSSFRRKKLILTKEGRKEGRKGRDVDDVKLPEGDGIEAAAIFTAVRGRGCRILAGFQGEGAAAAPAAASGPVIDGDGMDDDGGGGDLDVDRGRLRWKLDVELLPRSDTGRHRHLHRRLGLGIHHLKLLPRPDIRRTCHRHHVRRRCHRRYVHNLRRVRRRGLACTYDRRRRCRRRGLILCRRSRTHHGRHDWCFFCHSF